MIFDVFYKFVLVFAAYIVYNYKRQREYSCGAYDYFQEVIFLAADMHCHTNRSDGSDSPEFVIRLARQIGLTALAITDHDYYSGAYDAHKLGESMGIRVINGVECSTFDYNHGNKVHILCYQVKRPDAIEELLSRETAARTEATLAMVNKATKIYPITEEMVTDGVSESGFIGKQHIMLALMKAGLAKEMYGELYRRLFNPKDGSCFVAVKQTDSLEAMRYLRESGGVIVLAHPSVYGSIAALDDLIKAGIHGIELNHPRNTPEHMQIIRQAAERHGLLLTGGTDFHGYFCESDRCLTLGSFTTTDEMIERFDQVSAGL